MVDIGIRELKIHASEIVREVRERGKRYIITHHGRPVAAIVPVEEAQAGSTPEGEAAIWEELTQLGLQIGQGWQSPQNSAEILSNLRR
jgi:prevent-host-death family protein